LRPKSDCVGGVPLPGFPRYSEENFRSTATIDAPPLNADLPDWTPAPLEVRPPSHISTPFPPSPPPPLRAHALLSRSRAHQEEITLPHIASSSDRGLLWSSMHVFADSVPIYNPLQGCDISRTAARASRHTTSPSTFSAWGKKTRECKTPQWPISEEAIASHRARLAPLVAHIVQSVSPWGGESRARSRYLHLPALFLASSFPRLPCTTASTAWRLCHYPRLRTHLLWFPTRSPSLQAPTRRTLSPVCRAGGCTRSPGQDALLALPPHCPSLVWLQTESHVGGLGETRTISICRPLFVAWRVSDTIATHAGEQVPRTTGGEGVSVNAWQVSAE